LAAYLWKKLCCTKGDDDGEREGAERKVVTVEDYRCLKSLEPMGILIIFLVFIYRL
jgi:hypothetical protein